MNFVEAFGWTVIALAVLLALLAWGARIHYEVSEGDKLGAGMAALLCFGIPVLAVAPFALSGFFA